MLGAAEHLRVIEHAPARTVEQQQPTDIAHRQTSVRQLISESLRWPPPSSWASYTCSKGSPRSLLQASTGSSSAISKPGRRMDMTSCQVSRWMPLSARIVRPTMPERADYGPHSVRAGAFVGLYLAKTSSQVAAQERSNKVRTHESLLFRPRDTIRAPAAATSVITQGTRLCPRCATSRDQTLARHISHDPDQCAHAQAQRQLPRPAMLLRNQKGRHASCTQRALGRFWWVEGPGCGCAYAGFAPVPRRPPSRSIQ